MIAMLVKLSLFGLLLLNFVSIVPIVEKIEPDLIE
ncbi:hypothetical protein BH10BAC4_BH10BAC4_19940 [soil metagenome]